MKKKFLTVILLVSMFYSMNVIYAEELTLEPSLTLEESEGMTVEVQDANYRLEAEITSARPDPNFYAHPGNIATIEGVGEAGEIVIRYEGSQIMKIPVSSPLYRITNVYCDSIRQKDGVWGIERKIEKIVFDGSEDWNLEENYRYENTKSTLFTIVPDITLKVKEGLSTHFQVLGGLELSSNTAEGISLKPDKWYFRVSNVRNIKSVDVWKEYLSAQNEAGMPVTLYTILPEPVFTPLDDEFQDKLSALDVTEIRYTEGIQPKIVTLPENSQPFFPFLTTDTWQDQEEFKKLSQSFTDMKIYNASPDDTFFIDSIEVNSSGNCSIKLASQVLGEDGLPLTKMEAEANFSFLDINFLSLKATEIPFTPMDGSSISATASINFLNFEIPKESITGLTYTESGLHQNCITKKELVLPMRNPVVETDEFRVYYNNLAFNGNIEKLDSVVTDLSQKGFTSTDKYLSIIPEKDSSRWIQKFILNAGEDKSRETTSFKTQFIPVPKDTGKDTEKTILFLGDSLIAQDFYSQAVVDKFEEDDMNVKLIGQKGLKTSPHEGRGGWSAYDYLSASVRFGESNPFLNHGEFDFSYYMKNNNYSSVDIVVLNLGINDLNQIGHNTHQEIIANFNSILNSIQKFNPDAKVVFAMPTLPFSKDATITAKNARLDFIKTLVREYGSKEEDGIFLMPLYVNIDPFTDYKFEQPLPNGALDVSDTSHPAVSGYQRLGETCYNMIKYIAFLEEDVN